MNNLLRLAVNEKYEGPISEGAKANFISTAGNLLQIGLHNISQQELLALKKHKAKIGMIADHPLILFLFDFGDGGQYDAPFNATLYTKEQFSLHNITNNEQRLLIEMHVVELNDFYLKVLRAFTMPPELTINFLAAAQDQIAKMSSYEYIDKLNKYMQYPIEQLINKTKMYQLGD